MLTRIMYYLCHHCSTAMVMVKQYQWQSVVFLSRTVFTSDNCWVLSKQAAEKRLKEYNVLGSQSANAQLFKIKPFLHVLHNYII